VKASDGQFDKKQFYSIQFISSKKTIQSVKHHARIVSVKGQQMGK